MKLPKLFSFIFFPISYCCSNKNFENPYNTDDELNQTLYNGVNRNEMIQIQGEVKIIYNNNDTDPVDYSIAYLCQE